MVPVSIPHPFCIRLWIPGAGDTNRCTTSLQPPPRGPSAPGLSYAVSSSSSLALMCSGGAALVDECEPANEICSPWTRCPSPPPTATVVSTNRPLPSSGGRRGRPETGKRTLRRARRLNDTTELLIAPKQPRLQDNPGSLPVQSEHNALLSFQDLLDAPTKLFNSLSIKVVVFSSSFYYFKSSAGALATSSWRTLTPTIDAVFRADTNTLPGPS